MRSTDELLETVARGKRPEYLYFWGHRPSSNGSVGKSCLSQWFEAPFSFEGALFPTAEHYMMACKAKLFGDIKAYEAILSAAEPGKAKALGRSVHGFDESVWLVHRWSIVVEANRLKFSQNEALKRFLLGTGEQVLVEASPVDRVWGIGLTADSPEAKDPAQWAGLNLLGYALMEVRSQLRSLAVQQAVQADVTCWSKFGPCDA